MNKQARTVFPVVVAAVLLPLPGVAATPDQAPDTARASVYAGSWSGRTGQDKDLTFKVNNGGRVTALKVSWSAAGDGCSIEATTTLKSLSAPINARKKFRVYSQMGNTAILVKGQMASKAKAAGSLRVTVIDTTGYGCSGTAQTSWTAHKG